MVLPESILSLPAEAASLVLLKLLPGSPPDAEEAVALGAAVGVYDGTMGEREAAMARAVQAWFDIRIRQVARFVEGAVDG